jgi:hypothetical protein
MKPVIVLLLLPVLLGVASHFLFRSVRSAACAATIGSVAAVCACVRTLDPDGSWGWLVALLVSPLVIAMAVITVMLCFGRYKAQKGPS